jgi:hypothetical protein
VHIDGKGTRLWQGQQIEFTFFIYIFVAGDRSHHQQNPAKELEKLATQLNGRRRSIQTSIGAGPKVEEASSNFCKTKCTLASGTGDGKFLRHQRH